MKGLLFTELLEMVEDNFGYRTANAIVLDAPLSSGGIYTASRSYHRSEMSLLFEQLQRHTSLSLEQLSIAFGRHLCKRIVSAYPQHRSYINRVFLQISRRSATPVFQYRIVPGKSLTVVYNPAAKAVCLTDGMIKGYIEELRCNERVVQQTGCESRQTFTLVLSE